MTAKSQIYRSCLMTIPMLAQMTLTLTMAVNGRPGLNPTIPDWVLHFIYYTILLFLSYLAFNGVFRQNHWKKNLLYSTICSIVFSFLDEGLQFFSSVRSAQVSDLIADSSGVVFGIIILFVLLNSRRRQNESNE